MVYVSPKLDALNLRKGASFTVFVGRVHYLVTVIERLAKTLPKYTCPSEEPTSNTDDLVIIDNPPAMDSPTHRRTLEDQTRQLEHDLRPHTPRMNPVPQNTLPRSSLVPFESKLLVGNDKALKQSANLANTMDEIQIKTIPILPKTPQYNSLAYGIASSRVPPTPISPCNLKDKLNRSKRETEYIPTTNKMAKQSSIITMKSEGRKTSPLSK